MFYLQQIIHSVILFYFIQLQYKVVQMLVDYRENLKKQYADICPYSFMCRIMMGGVNFDIYTERFIKKTRLNC